jgi:hypothetical protein
VLCSPSAGWRGCSWVVVRTTAEVDSIIAVHKASSAPGVVTDVATPRVHSRNSWHYVKNDPWTGKPVTPSATPGGTAVDFGGATGPLSSADALAVFTAFVSYGRAGLLMELFCAQAYWCVYRGRFMPWDEVPGPARHAIHDAHRNHTHVSVRPGVFLQPLQHEEDDVPYPHSCAMPSGRGWWQLNPDGSVETHAFKENDALPFHGSAFDYPQERTKINPKTGKPRVWTTIEPVGPRDEDGYFLFADDGFCGKLKK